MYTIAMMKKILMILAMVIFEREGSMYQLFDKK